MAGELLSPRHELGEESAAPRVAELEAEIDALRQRQAELLLFAGQLAHDLRVPLAAASGFAALLERPIGAQARKRSLERVRTNLAQLGEMIDMHLDAARRAAGRGAADERVELDVVVDWVLFTLADRIAESKTRINRRPLPSVLGDEAGLRRLYQNLVDNAISHRDPRRPLVVGLDAVRNGHSWLLTVSDNGPGIPPDERQEVLRFRGHATEDGTLLGGLGLPSCRRVVESLGGDLWIEDGQDGVGTRVAFTLSAAD